MSLRADDRSSRGYSGSSRDRSRSRGDMGGGGRAISPPSAPRYPHPPQGPAQPSSVMPGSFDDSYRDEFRSPTNYEVRSRTERGGEGGDLERPGYSRRISQPPASSAYPQQSNMPYPAEDDRFVSENYWKDLPPHQRPGYKGPGARYPTSPDDEDEDDRALAYGDVHSPNGSRQHSYSKDYAPRPPQQPYRPASPTRPNGPYAPQPQQQHRPGIDSRSQSYGEARQSSYDERNRPVSYADTRSESYSYKYAEPPEKISYTNKASEPSRQSVRYAETPQAQFNVPRTYEHNAYDRESHIHELTPSAGLRERASSTVKTVRHSLDVRGDDSHAASSRRLSTGMSLLSVGGTGNHTESAGGPPPPSPLLEAYHGTYQSMTPMHLATREPDDDDLSDLELMSPTLSRTGTLGETSDKKKKRVKLYDPEKDATTMADALKHHKVNNTALCDVLPGLTHDEIMYLRKEYKKQVKVQGKGVNLPKHMKTKLTGNFGKVAYVTALGRWESEGYWANFFYQSHSSRRELLIESLMGRTNAEIRNMDEEFKDKRYGDSLIKCMEKELKVDKFKAAVMIVLEQKRQEEQDVYPTEYRSKDVRDLHRALTAERGGETAMLEIIVRRSDAHLRLVIDAYQREYGENFPRAALRKSNNLVGEVIAHILNGVINKPARDAMLLHHAIVDIRDKNRDEDLRYELLISRLVRLHWDRPHLLRVKREYEIKYRVKLEQDISQATKGDFCEFLVELCAVKVPSSSRE